MKIAALIGLVFICSNALLRAQTNPIGHYSNMQYVEESGDLIGFDLRVEPAGTRYRVTLFCAEGFPHRVRQTVPMQYQALILIVGESGCGHQVKLKLTRGGVFLSNENGESDFLPRHRNYLSDFLPRHRNYLKEEYWK